MPRSEIPQIITALQAKTNFVVPLRSISSGIGKTETVFGEVNTDYIIETKNETDEIFYTFPVIPNTGNEGSEVYNLVVKTNDTETQSAKVLVYEPTAEWILNGNNDYLTFSGTVYTYSLDGNLESTVSYLNGVGDCTSEPCPDCPTQQGPGGGGGGPGGPGTGIPPTGTGGPVSYPNTGGGSGGGSSGGCGGWVLSYYIRDNWGNPTGEVYINSCGQTMTVQYRLAGDNETDGVFTANRMSAPACQNQDTGGGVVIITESDPCAKTSITSANNILKNSEVQSKMDAVLRSKRNATNEFAVSVGKNDNSYNVTSPKEGDQHSGTIPPVLSGNYVADGHSHPNGSYGTPSAGDFYNFILRFPASPYLESRFVYGSYFGDAEVYALVVHSKAMAQNFVNLYPKNENYNDITAMFIENSALGIEYKKALDYANIGTYQNTTDEYYSSSAMALAYVLGKFNTGISLAKVDANGNLKKIDVSIETITVSGGNGTPKTGLKITKCP